MVTDEDRERAAALVPDHQHWCQVVGHGDCCARDASDCDCGVQESRDAVAEALADERERVLRPVLEVAEELEDLGHGFGITAAGDSARNDLVAFRMNESVSNTLRDFADRIRRAAGVTE